MANFLKYAPEDSAGDPIFRCDDCKTYIAKVFIHHNGCCHKCGNRRVKTVSMISAEELEALKAGTYDIGVKDYEIDPAFFALFSEEVQNV